MTSDIPIDERRISDVADSMAEREGFEPSVPVVKLADDVAM